MALRLTSRLSLLAAIVVLAACGGRTGSPGPDALRNVDGNEIGVQEHLGAVLPDGMTFKDEDGKEVDFKSLLTKPTVLTLVYLRCKSICGPVMNEVAHTVDEVTKVRPGKDYNLITVSFDAREGPDLAKSGQASLLGRMKTDVPPEAWHFLTGSEADIKKLTEAVGFYFKQDKDGEMIHAGSVVFLTKEGKIVRYLGGLLIHPFDMEMAINDAAEGTPRTLMQRVQQICYSYDPEGRQYTFNFVLIAMFATLVLVGLFVVFLVVTRKKTSATRNKPTTADGAMEGGAA